VILSTLVGSLSLRSIPTSLLSDLPSAQIYFTFDSSSSSPSSGPCSGGFIHGILSNGIPYHFSLPNPAAASAQQNNLVGLTTSDGWCIKAKLTSIPEPEPSTQRAPSDPQAAEAEHTTSSSSFASFLSSVFCGCQQKTRPITPQDSHSPQTHPGPFTRSPAAAAAAEDENIYLICLSRGRDVYNGFARGKDLVKRGFH
jgi:hypothetical protein